MRNLAHIDPQKLHEWLKHADDFPSECDGTSLAISILLSRENISHIINVGTLTIAEKRIPLHHWISLENSNVIIDYRARMWLGDDPQIPHGVFTPSKDQEYKAQGFSQCSESISEMMFYILTLQSLHTYPRLNTLI